MILKQPWPMAEVDMCNRSTQQPLLRSAAFGALRTFEVVGGTCQGTSVLDGALGAKVGEASKSPKQAVVTPKKLPSHKKRLQQRSIFKDPKRMGEVGILPLDFGIRFWDS